MPIFMQWPRVPVLHVKSPEAERSGRHRRAGSYQGAACTRRIIHRLHPGNPAQSNQSASGSSRRSLFILVKIRSFRETSKSWRLELAIARCLVLAGRSRSMAHAQRRRIADETMRVLGVPEGGWRERQRDIPKANQFSHDGLRAVATRFACGEAFAYAVP
jgi:hypothetical protein